MRTIATVEKVETATSVEWEPYFANCNKTVNPMKKPVRWVFLALGFTLLAGCGLNDALHRMDLATYRRSCEEFGFTLGTTAFSQCMQQQAAQRAREVQQSVDRAHFDNAIDKLK